MSNPIVVDFPFKDQVPTTTEPKSRDGLYVVWGDRTEFVPDPEEDECLTDAQGAAL